MKTLRLQNFRSLVDTGQYDLKPITLLVGANSSGKSSYLRFFPLLRQTAEKQSRSPLLWFGDDVDFGDFSKVAFHGNTSSSIGVEIKTNIISRVHRYRPDSIDIPLTISMVLKASQAQGTSQATYVSRIEVRSWDDLCVIDFSEDDTITSFVANGMDIKPYFKHKTIQAIRGKFFPYISYSSENDSSSDFDFEFFDYNYPAPPLLHSALGEYLKSLAHNRIGTQKIAAYSKYLSFRDADSMLKTIKGFRLRHLASPSLDDEQFKKIRALVFASDISRILVGANAKMADFAAGISYLGPFRKNPERFYRQQELSIGQIESHGENLAMFLRGLTPSQLDDLSKFAHDYFGIRVSVMADGSHVSIFVEEGPEEGPKRRHNLIDMGYGLSQVLPVLALCWTTAYGIKISGREQATSVLAIEQPELHLHPRHQMRLADMFAMVVKSANTQRTQMAKRRSYPRLVNRPFPLALVIETHSEALVNRLGELIQDKQLDNSDVNVLLFEKDANTGITTIRKSVFSPEGELQNWPLGFFSA